MPINNAACKSTQRGDAGIPHPATPVSMGHDVDEGRLRLLVIDDEEDFNKMRDLLAHAGGVKIDLEWVTTYEDALEAMNRKSHDVYLLGCRVGERPGLELLREAVAAGCKTPIIYVAARRDQNEDVKTIKAGAADYLVSGELSAPLLTRSIRYALERKRAEEAFEKVLDAATESACVRSEFLANMSHEMKTPLNAIIGMIELTLDSDLTHRQHENLMLAKFSADSLLHIINDILDFPRMESDRRCPKGKEFSFRKTLKNSLCPLQLKAEQKGLSLVKHVPEDLPDLLIGDAERFAQIVTKLAENAIKFTERGEVMLDVEIDSVDGAGLVLHCIVGDTGIGIPPDCIEKIFLPFTQVDGSLSRKYGGTGLGLSLVRDKVSALGGKVWVESEVGRGSRFHFTVKFGVPKGKSTMTAAASDVFSAAAVTVSPRRNLRILMAEDSLVNQMMFSEMLEKNGHTVAVASDGRRALDAYRKGNFDLILMDIQMPEMDGYEATGMIRTLEEGKGAHIPIIALTGSDFQGDEEKCLRAGMDGYLAKPLSERELMTTMARFVTEAEVERMCRDDTTSLPVSELLDTELALDNLGGDRKLWREIMVLFLKEAPAQIVRLREAIADREEERIESSAHKLKGMAAHVGAVKIADEAFRIQLAVRKGDREKPVTALQNIETMFEQLRQELSGFYGGSLTAP
ncbi:MAG: hypothetical protein FD174_4234 [Geobacteraceae bacterium]|nr:MAG: hypothetical protein FD174_4234 [Geobacteraceae bacterium]